MYCMWWTYPMLVFVVCGCDERCIGSRFRTMWC